MSSADLKRREMATKEKKIKLQNPNFFISKTRLSVRNIPKTVDSAELKKLALEGSV